MTWRGASKQEAAREIVEDSRWRRRRRRWGRERIEGEEEEEVGEREDRGGGGVCSLEQGG